MKVYVWISVLALCFSHAATGQKLLTAKEELANYKQVVTERAHKIVATLGVTDSLKFKKVREVIAQQYVALRQIHDARDKQVATAKSKADYTKQQLDEAVKKIEAEATSQQHKLHGKYVAKLSKNLSSAQVDKVKDGMTYDALPITYRNYLAMIPGLTEQQKVQIKAWLTEAREYAMDGGSSKEKLGWFGKYKGKITNYLTAAGYDLKKEEANWLNRTKKEKAGNNSFSTTEGAKRADVILDSLAIKDEQKQLGLHTILLQHFDTLNSIFSARKTAMDAAANHADKELANARGEAAWSAANSKLNKLHATFLGKLSVELTANQIEKVKDVMTEGGRQKEYNHFLELFPNLNAIQKAQVWAYLTEARENAMDAESANVRNQWFIKYRGRANNFLSAAGYDLRKATDELNAKK